jgi:chromate transporter
MKKCLELFFLFFRVSLFTLGGGLAMLPLVEREITENKKWLDKEEFLDIVGISQSMPGVMILNVATTVGYKISRLMGSVFACLGAILPPFISIVFVGWFFIKIKDSPIVERIFSGVRPAVIALVAIPVINLSRAAKINMKTFFIPLGVILAMLLFDIHPVSVIVIAILVNMFYSVRIAQIK